MLHGKRKAHPYRNSISYRLGSLTTAKASIRAQSPEDLGQGTPRQDSCKHTGPPGKHAEIRNQGGRRESGRMRSGTEGARGAEGREATKKGLFSSFLIRRVIQEQIKSGEIGTACARKERKGNIPMVITTLRSVGSKVKCPQSPWGTRVGQWNKKKRGRKSNRELLLAKIKW